MTTTARQPRLPSIVAATVVHHSLAVGDHRHAKLIQTLSALMFVATAEPSLWLVCIVRCVFSIMSW
jgi:hypothetical protein